MVGRSLEPRAEQQQIMEGDEESVSLSGRVKKHLVFLFIEQNVPKKLCKCTFTGSDSVEEEVLFTQIYSFTEKLQG